jgi:hypothetical protein
LEFRFGLRREEDEEIERHDREYMYEENSQWGIHPSSQRGMKGSILLHFTARKPSG